MGLVLILTSGAVIILKAYNTWKDAAAFVEVIAALRQQAAVLATLSLAVFVVLEALEKGKVALSGLSVAGVAAATATAPQFGRPTGLSAQAITGS